MLLQSGYSIKIYEKEHKIPNAGLKKNKVIIETKLSLG